MTDEARRNVLKGIALAASVMTPGASRAQAPAPPNCSPTSNQGQFGLDVLGTAGEITESIFRRSLPYGTRSPQKIVAVICPGVLGRRICNSWNEKDSWRKTTRKDFDVVIIGAGMFGAYLADKLYRKPLAPGKNLSLARAGERGIDAR